MADLIMKYSEQLKQLLTLREPQQDASLNYSSLGFCVTHVDELIRMATDPELLNADEGNISFWGAVHAWRALGELKITRAIVPMLDLREQYSFDLLFDEEFPAVIALMGKSAIPELKRYLFDENREEVERSNALPCLEEIGGAYRQECLSIITELLQETRQDCKILAGLAICVLVELEATETIETIRDVFARDCVDIGIPGDIEDVEIALGLRSKRDTPAPNYNFLPPEMTQTLERLLELEESKSDAQSNSKVGRNDPCPCGSGKKYKKCCLH